jgi:hypothetical protein
MRNWLGRIFGSSGALGGPTGGWERIELPVNFSPLIEFSIPDGDHLWALSRRGLHSVTLAPEVSVRTVDPSSLDASVYDEERGVLRLDGHEYPLLGQHGGDAITTLDNGEQVQYSRCHETNILDLLVQDAAGRSVLAVTVWGAWEFGYATFSRCGRYIAFGSAPFLTVFRRAAAGARQRQVRRLSLYVNQDDSGNHWVTEIPG